MKIPKPEKHDGEYFYEFQDGLVQAIVSRCWQKPQIWLVEIRSDRGPYICDEHKTKKACELAMPRLLRAMPGPIRHQLGVEE